MTEKARILFVDDEKRVLNAMRGLFRRDYELFLTTEGAEAVRIATENDIDVIVADQRMPGMTGIEVLGQVKVNSPRTVRILLTGYADPSAVEGSINIGEVFRFLSKPCPPNTLRETLSLAIEASQTQPKPPVAAQAAPPTPEPAVDAANEAETAPPVAPQQPVAEPITEPATAPPASTPEPATATPAASQQPVAEDTTPEPAAATPAGDPGPASAPATAEQTAETASANDESPEAADVADADQTEPALQTLDEAAIAQASSDESSSHWQSVTNVIMTEDSVEETSENVMLTPATSGIKDIGVVVFTVDSEFAADCIKSLSSDRKTILATTLVKVAQAIEHENAGILVTDFTTNSAMLQKMIAALKRYLPELITIVVSNGRDTTDMINLINHGQVFRYALKPIEHDRLRHDINAAAIQHLYLLNNPESQKRHSVVNEAANEEPSPSINTFLGKIRHIQQSRSDPTDTIT